MASKFEGTDNYRDKFKAVPWTSEDGEPFPDGQHVALTHWSVGGEGDTDGEARWASGSTARSSAAPPWSTFMDDYPYIDSPEPNAM